MTPTPEDIALATHIEHTLVGCDGVFYLATTAAAELIAEHCAKLREKIAALELELVTVKRDREYLATHWAGQVEAAHKVIAESATNPGRVPVLVGGNVVADSFGSILFREQPHSMVELAKIGRLAVELERIGNFNWGEKHNALCDAIDSATRAYIAKEPKV